MTLLHWIGIIMLIGFGSMCWQFGSQMCGV